MDARAARPDPRTRSFLLSGRAWIVEEAAGTNALHDGACLVFTTDHLLRRVWEYPQEWFGLTDAELGRICTSRRPQSSSGTAMTSAEMLQELRDVSAAGGQRDQRSLTRFQEIAVELRGLTGASGFFRAKVASATAWAALLFSGWRHRKYDRPEATGAQRIRQFIERDLRMARENAPPGAAARNE